MSSPAPATPIERIASHPAVDATLTYAAAAIGTPLAALLPVLTKALASERQRQRVEDTLAEMNRILVEHEDKLKTLTDSQYKLLNETLLALLHTTEVEKFQYLRRAVANTLLEHELLTQDAAVLSRTVRDMSAAEAAFVIRNYGFSRIWLTTAEDDNDGKALIVDPNSAEAVIVSGLASLGLLLSSSSDYAGLGMLNWSPVTAKLIAILRETDA